MVYTKIAYLALCLLLLHTSSWADGEQPSSLFDRIHQTTSSDNSSKQRKFSLRPTYLVSPFMTGRLKDIVSDSEGVRSKGLQGSFTSPDGKLNAETEIAFAGNPESAQEALNESRRRMVRFTLTGVQGSFRYGAFSQTAGKAYVQCNNQSSREVWGEYGYGATRLRTAVGQNWNNVDGDPNQLRLLHTYGRLAVSLVQPHWPELSMSYTRGSLMNAFVSGGTPAQQAATDGLEASILYARPTWYLRFATQYSMNNNQLPGTRDTTAFAESFMASYRPSTTLNVIPSIGYRAAVDQWSGSRLETPSASVSIDYRATKNVFVSALSAYSITHSNDGTVDLESVNSRALLAWTFPIVAFPETPPIVAIEASYTLIAHHAVTLTDLQDVSGLLRLIIEEF